MSGPGDWRGGCQCGAVSYRLSGSASAPTICHCESCRRSAGAPIVSWVTVPAQALHMDRREPRIYASSERVERGFCPVCGTTLTYRHLDYPGTVDVSTATLDEPERLPPVDEIWTADRLSFMSRSIRLPTYARTRKG